MPWWDVSEIRTLAADLNKSAATLSTEVKQVVAKGAVNIKKQLREEMKGSEHFKGAAYRISYDLGSPQPDSIVAEIGPTSGPGDPGSLANIAYFGTSRGGGTVPDPSGALEAEGARTVAYLSKLLGGVL